MVAAAMAMAPLFAAGCSESTGSAGRQLGGAEVSVGQGTARTDVTLSRAGEPRSVAVVLSEGALAGLPAGAAEFVLPMPAGAAGLPFDHVALNWQHTGHPPAGTYTTPHFDVHFYLVSAQQRDAMTPADPQWPAKVARQPAAESVPAGYRGDPGGVPRMGVHWINPAAPEHHGQPFTHTMIYGFYDGAMVFIEPMITKAFLESRPDVTVDVAVPSRYPRPGAYPTRYTVRYDASRREYRIELGGLVARG